MIANATKVPGTTARIVDGRCRICFAILLLT